jgi:glycosyltransferase involved in cell wall biosynthesis
MQNKKILFLLLYPLNSAPNQRFRAEIFFSELKKADISFDINCFMDHNTWNTLYKPGFGFRKGANIFWAYLKRLYFILFHLGKYEFIFIPREAAPLGPPLFEWIIAKIFRKKIIYDFDDAIWISNKKQNLIVRLLKCHWKVGQLCKWSYKVVCGNTYLGNFAKKFNPATVIIPTCVDTITKHNRLKDQQAGKKIVIGWTGSHSTMPYLDMFMPIFRKLTLKYSLELIIISNKTTQYQDTNIRHIVWTESNEVEDLLEMNIGIMPLTNDAWSEGKCGFKLIQYLAVGIPVLASPVGVNKIIVDNGQNGFLCETQEDWYDSAIQLIESEELRTKMGTAGREKIQKEYCIHSKKDVFLQLFS